MMAGIGAALAVFVAAIFPSVGSSTAAEVTQPGISIAYALLLDGEDPVYGQATCEIRVRCQLIDNPETSVRLSATIESKQYLAGEVRVDCGNTGCSFSTSKKFARLEAASGTRSLRQFDLYAGEGDSVDASGLPQDDEDRSDSFSFRKPVKITSHFVGLSFTSLRFQNQRRVRLQ